MTVKRLVAIAIIFIAAAIAWFALAGSLLVRTGQSDYRLADEVRQLWGGSHNQVAPEITLARSRPSRENIQEKDAQGHATTRQVTRTVTDTVALAPAQSRVSVGLKLDHRRKGLLWYDTYAVQFDARYRVANPDGVPRRVTVRYQFPAVEAIYDDFSFALDGREVPPSQDLSQGITTHVEIPANGAADVAIRYRSRGTGMWTYALAASGVAQVRDFSLTATTDFDGLDFPAGTISPTTKERAGRGWTLTWSFANLITGQKIGVDPPDKQNPGPLAARITFFAPVALLFFVLVTVVLGVLGGASLHPMNYFFLSGAFFAFHLLLAYLVDHINIHAAFAIASATSIFLVATYLRLVAGNRFMLQAAAAQLVFLVLLSYAFFFEGYAGLTVTIGAVVTLFVLMQMTGKVDWAQVFRGERDQGAPLSR